MSSYRSKAGLGLATAVGILVPVVSIAAISLLTMFLLQLMQASGFADCNDPRLLTSTGGYRTDAQSSVVQRAVVENWSALLRYAYRLCHDRARAEDLVQDAVVRALEQETQYQARGSVEGWLRTILRNSFRMAVRGNREVPGLLEFSSSQQSAEEEAIANVYRRDLQQWLARQLAPKEHELMELYYGSELSVERIATRLDTTTSAIKCRLYRLRRRVQALGLADES